jgi:hypothetical protein
MTNITKEFVFEDSPVRLRDGTEFVPLRDALARFKKGWSTQEGMESFRFLILYELPRGHFILAEYTPCTKQVEHRGALRRRCEIWKAPNTPRAEAIEHAEAYDLFNLHWSEHELPEVLKAFETSLPPAPAADTVSARPLEYWEKLRPPLQVDLPAHLAARLEYAVAMFFGLWRFKQLLRMWTDVQVFPNLTLMESLTSQLLGAYPVDPNHWPKGKKPPKTVNIKDLPWPEHLSDVGTCLGVIRQFFAGAMRCFACRLLPPDAPSRPSWDELHIAIAELRSLAGPLEQVLPHLEQSIALAENLEEMRLRESEYRALRGQTAEIGRVANAEPCRPSDLRAYASWLYALDNLPPDDIRPSDAYRWLKENGCGPEGLDYVLPEYESWRRQVNRVRQSIKLTGFDPLGQRTSSIVNQSQL